MKRRRILYFIVAAILAAGLSGPASNLWSYWKGEPFYRGKPASYWSSELSQWHESVYLLNDVPTFTWFRRRARWEGWVLLYVPRPRRFLPQMPPILDGDVVAFDVLLALLQDANPQVRRMAACGLGSLHRAARPAIPALHKMLHDPDDGVRLAVSVALSDISAETKRGVIALTPLEGDRD